MALYIHCPGGDVEVGCLPIMMISQCTMRTMHVHVGVGRACIGAYEV